MAESPATTVSQLSAEEKRKLLARLIAEKERSQRNFPLTWMQESLWFLEQLAPGKPAYHLHKSSRLEGALDHSRLEKSLRHLVHRQEALRTTFEVIDGQPVQRIHPPGEFTLERTDLTHLAADAQRAEGRRLSQHDVKRPFDLQSGPLWRARLVQLGPREHVLVTVFHHIIADGASMGLFTRELLQSYAALEEGREIELPPLSLQYADYALWQREKYEGTALREQLAYWQQRLDGHPDLLELPTDRPRPANQSFNGQRVKRQFPAQLSQSLREFGRRHGATPYMTLLAGFQALLARYSRQRDILVGSPVANRPRPELEPIIGFFANMIVLRTDVDPRLSFEDLLARVRSTALSAYMHQEMPFDLLVQKLQPRRDASRQPIFQVTFALQPARQRETRASLAARQLQISPIPTETGASKFDLAMMVVDKPEGLQPTLEFSTDLFDGSTAERMLCSYERLLLAALEQPGMPLADLDWLAPDERRQLISQWNDTRRAYPRDRTVQEVFEAQATERPDAIAIVSDGVRMTYRELNQRANRLGRYLAQRGAGTESSVGVCLPRCSDAVVAMLAVLKAGGVYVPLDEEYPRQRLQFMLEQTSASLVLTQSSAADGLSDLGMTVIDLESRREEIAALPGEDLPLRSCAGNLAYVMYTSGSTGTPKGIGICHRSILRLVLSSTYLECGPAEVFLQYAPLTFDAATLEVWGPLLTGGRLVVCAQRLASHEELGRLIRQEGVTTAWFTAGLFHQLIDHGIDELRGLRQLIAGGDVLSPSHARRALEQLSLQRLVNGYGPTENTTFTCCHVMTGAQSVGTTLPIGRPIENTRVYVLDERLNPVPLGVPGQLYAAGDGLARGYLGAAELTAGQFLPDPFAEQPGERMYATGDLARYRSDGTIEFLGRLDEQVKIRGFRIEPGEVEAAIQACPEVQRALVIPRANGDGEKRLVAYVLLHEAGGDVTRLRAAIAQRLPAYMLPAIIVEIDALPLNANGKVDRRALPEPAIDTAPDGELAEPRNEIENAVLGIWREVLGIATIGVHDDFFQLGGHSLLAVQVIQELRKRLGVSLPLTDIFAAPSIAELAQRVHSAPHADRSTEDTRRKLEDLLGLGGTKGEDPESPLVPLKTSGTKRALYFVHGHLGHVLGLGRLAQTLDEDRPFYALRARGLGTGDIPFSRVEQMAAFYLQAIRARQPHGPYVLGGLSMGGLIALEMAQQLRRQNETVELLVLLDSHAADPEKRVAPDEVAMARWMALRLGMDWAALEGDPPDVFWPQILAAARRSKLVPPQVEVDDFKHVSQVFFAHDEAFRSYRPQRYDGEVLLFLATDRPTTDRAEEKDLLGYWSNLCAHLTPEQIPGSHATMMREPHVQLLGQRLGEHLARIERGA